MMDDNIYANLKQGDKEDTDQIENNFEFNFEADHEEKDSIYKLEAMKLIKWNKMVLKLDEYLDKSNKIKYKAKDPANNKVGHTPEYLIVFGKPNDLWLKADCDVQKNPYRIAKYIYTM